MKLKFSALILALLSVVSVASAAGESTASTRQERRLINKGNSLYNDRKFNDAQKAYEQAIAVQPSSAEARYNLGLSQIRQVTNIADSNAQTRSMVDAARKNFTDVAAMARIKPGLAAKANFNLGNIEFNSKDFQKAIEYYKQALRIDPTDDKARKNLRIAQKNLQKQNQDKNKDNKDQNKDKNKDQNKDQNRDQNKDQNQNKDSEKDKKQDQQNISKQTASQILQAIDNKESATRARVNKANKGEKAVAGGRNNRRW